MTHDVIVMSWWYTGGSPTWEPSVATPQQRFFEKFTPAPRYACWNWNSGKSGGWGRFWWDGSTNNAHIFAFNTWHEDGPKPPGLEWQIDHICNNRACVNPEHLRLLHITEHTAITPNASTLNAAKDYCDNGHEFTPENTYIRPDRGTRQCRACHRERARRGRERRRQQKAEA